MIDDKYLLGVLQSAQPPSRGRSVLGEGREVFVARSNLAPQPQEPVATTNSAQDVPFVPNIEIPHAEGSGNEAGSIPDVIIVFNGTASYVTLSGDITGPV